MARISALIMVWFTLITVNNAQLKVIEITPPSSGKLYINIGRATVDKRPSLLLTYNLGPIMEILMQTNTLCNEVLYNLILARKNYDENIIIVQNQTCFHLEDTADAVNNLMYKTLLDLNPDLSMPNVKTAPRFETLKGTDQEVQINEQTAYWHKTKTLIAGTNQMKTAMNETLYKILSKSQINLRNKTTAMYNDVFKIRQSILDTSDEIKTFINNSFYAPKQLPTTVQLIIKHYLSRYGNQLDLLNNPANYNWRINQVLLRQNILLFRINIPFNLTKMQFDVLAPLDVPIEVVKDNYYQILNKAGREEKLILRNNHDTYAEINSHEVFANELEPEVGLYSIYPQILYSGLNKSCNFDILTENVTSAQTNCVWKPMDAKSNFILYKLGQSHAYFYVTSKISEIKIRCKNAIVNKKIKGVGFINLDKPCSLFSADKFSIFKTYLPRVNLENPNYEQSLKTYFFPEKFVISKLPAEIKRKYAEKVVKSAKQEKIWYNILFKLADKNHKTIVKMNVTMCALLLIFYAYKIYKFGRSHGVIGTEKETDKYTLRNIYSSPSPNGSQTELRALLNRVCDHVTRQSPGKALSESDLRREFIKGPVSKGKVTFNFCQPPVSVLPRAKSTPSVYLK
jgi:hypothetical protein